MVNKSNVLECAASRLHVWLHRMSGERARVTPKFWFLGFFPSLSLFTAISLLTILCSFLCTAATREHHAASAALYHNPLSFCFLVLALFLVCMALYRILSSFDDSRDSRPSAAGDRRRGGGGGDFRRKGKQLRPPPPPPAAASSQGCHFASLALGEKEVDAMASAAGRYVHLFTRHIILLEPPAQSHNNNSRGWSENGWRATVIGSLAGLHFISTWCSPVVGMLVGVSALAGWSVMLHRRMSSERSHGSDGRIQ